MLSLTVQLITKLLVLFVYTAKTHQDFNPMMLIV